MRIFKHKYRGAAKAEKGQTAFNAYVGYSGTKNALSRFKNPSSTNSIATYNPFKETLDTLGADEF